MPTVTFTASGIFTVDARVTSVTFTAYGAAGGNGGNTGSFPGDPPGLGGSGSATIAVTVGEQFIINVGTKGADGTASSGSSPGVGGVGGTGNGVIVTGGNGGNGGRNGTSPFGGGGGGGGQSSVVNSASLSVIVIGGGGGGGSGASGFGLNPGGNGGTPNGQNASGGGAGGGSQTAGGYAGFTYPGTGDNTAGGGPPIGFGGKGTDGQFTIDNSPQTGAGGGGAGFYGGGGGGTDSSGGGGSGFGTDAGLSASVNGSVVVTYTQSPLPPPAPEIIVSPASTPIPVFSILLNFEQSLKSQPTDSSHGRHQTVNYTFQILNSGNSPITNLIIYFSLRPNKVKDLKVVTPPHLVRNFTPATPMFVVAASSNVEIISVPVLLVGEMSAFQLSAELVADKHLTDAEMKRLLPPFDAVFSVSADQQIVVN